jgi:hypothetical protein
MSAISLPVPTDSTDPEIEDENLFGISVVPDVLDGPIQLVTESCSSEEDRPCSQPDDEEEERPCSLPDEEEESPCSMPEEEEERPCSMDENES